MKKLGKFCEKKLVIFHIIFIISYQLQVYYYYTSYQLQVEDDETEGENAVQITA